MAELEQKTIDELNGLVVTLRGYNEKLEKGVISTAEFKEREDKIVSEIKSVQDMMDVIQTKLNTPGMAVSSIDPREQEVKAFANFMAKGVASPEEMKLISMDNQTTGGIFMPNKVSNKIVEAILNVSPVRQFATVEQTEGDNLDVPKEAGTFSSGLLAERGTPAATTNMTFAMDKIPVHATYCEPYITQKSLDMATFNFEGWITSNVSKRFAADEGGWFVNGTGVGQPEGILTNASVAAVNSGDATGLTADGIMSLAWAVVSQYINGSRFMMRRATELSVMLLKDGTGRYIWQPSYQAGAPSMLCGFPIAYGEDVPAVAGSAYPIIFGNFAEGYRIADNPKMTVIRDIYTAKGQVIFFTQRYVGGQVVNPAAFKKQYISA